MQKALEGALADSKDSPRPTSGSWSSAASAPTTSIRCMPATSRYEGRQRDHGVGQLADQAAHGRQRQHPAGFRRVRIAVARPARTGWPKPWTGLHISPAGTAAPGADAPQLRDTPQRAARIRRRRGPQLRRRRALYERFPALPEGDLSRVRAGLVNKDTLARVARALGLGAEIRLGEGETKSGGAERPSILADALEAVFGAVFVDGGFDARARVIVALLRRMCCATPTRIARQGPEDAAAGVAAGAPLPVPEYVVIATTGEAHAQQFAVECRIPALAIVRAGEGGSRRVAEQAAADGGEAAGRSSARARGTPRGEVTPRRGVSLRPRGHRRPAERRQVDAAQRAGRRRRSASRRRSRRRRATGSPASRPRAARSSSSSTRRASRPSIARASTTG